MPLFLILLGIIQFGFIFNTYITMTNAARDAARLGTIYVYDRVPDKQTNDQNRNNAIKAQILASMNGLSTTSPRFATGLTWSSSTAGTTKTYTNGDLVIKYDWTDVTENVKRVTQRGELFVGLTQFIRPGKFLL